MATDSSQPGPVRDVGEPSDLGEARQTIAALRERLRRAEARADGFVRMVHEIRTLLGAVTGLSAILLDGELQDEQRDHVKRIRTSGAALREVVNGVLDFSKLEAGTLQVDTVDFDLRRQLEEVVALAADRATAKHLDLVACVDPDVPTLVAGDKVRLRQALLNLVVNAIKFTEEGSVVLRARAAASADGQSGRADIAIDVVDTGAGIAPDALPNIFEPFRQADGPAEVRSEGTGLGLSIVRGFVTAMGGRVSCQSTLGRGTTFTVELPLALRKAGAVRSQRGDVSGRRLLLIEPIEAARNDLAAAMTGLGLDVVAFPTITAACHHHSTAGGEPRAVDAVVLGVAARDTRWPAELAKLVRAIPSAKLILSTHEPSLAASLVGVVAVHLQRPFRLSRVLSAIEASFASMEDTVSGLAPQSDVQPRPRDDASRSTETNELSRLCTLVVEDDQVNARIARHVLEKRGWMVEIAVDGREAVERARRKRYDLVLLDWHTPRLDGLSAAREIRAMEAPGQHVPLVALTAIATEGAREQCLDAGMDDFLTKPIMAAELDAVLGKVVVGAYGKKNASKPRRPDQGGIDFDVLATLAVDTSDSPTMLPELGRIFVESARKRVADLREAIARSDAEAAHLAAHSLRGMCAQVGAGALSNHCMHIEQDARRGVISARPSDVDLLEAELARVVDGLAAWFDSWRPTEHARSA